MRKVKVGIIGCGVICETYLRNLIEIYKKLEVVAVADMFPEKAKAMAEKFGVPKWCSVEELLADPEIEMVANLTIPAAHKEVNIAALKAGKHVYCEKPFALNLEDAEEIIKLAESKGLLLGCAPDTILGAGIQTCRKIIEDGWIGTPIAATANMICSGHEKWHPAPVFYYKEGGGPMLDMGPYYIAALVSLLGPIDKVSCFAKKSFNKRAILSQPLRGTEIDVEVNTHYAGLMEFKSGLIANINMSFDIWLSNQPCIEIYGTEGTLVVPDPNMFGGTVKLLRGNNMVDSIEGLSVGEAVDRIHSPEMFEFFKEVPLAYNKITDNMRGLGMLDMAYALIEGREHRTNGQFAYHVLEALGSFDIAAEEGRSYVMQSTCKQPAPIPTGLEIGTLD
jgi:predicted dehydrogenase